YTELMFWALVGTGLFIRSLDEPIGWAWTAYAGVLTAAAYTHLSAILFFGSHAVVYAVLLVHDKMSHARGSGALRLRLAPLKAFALAGVLIFLLYAPALPQIIAAVQTVATSSSPIPSVAAWNNPVWTVLEILRNLRGLGIVTSFGLPAVLFFV